MPFTDKQRVVLVANLTTTLDLGPLSRFPAAGQLDVYANTSIAAEASLDVLIGTALVCQNAIINNDVTADVLDLQVDLMASGRGNANDPITIRINNLAANAPVVNILTAVS